MHVPLAVMNVHSVQLHVHPDSSRAQSGATHVRLVQTRVRSGRMIAVSGHKPLLLSFAVAFVQSGRVPADENAASRGAARRWKEFLMARSFFAGTDAELYTGSAAFSAKINQSPESFGLS